MKTARVRKRSKAETGFHGTAHVKDVPGGKDLLPIDSVESVIERYTGRAIPLELVYPEPPGAKSGNPIIDHDSPAPRRDVIPISDPTAGRREIATDKAYRQEARLRLVHRFLMRGASMSQIAEALGSTMSEAFGLRTELFRRVSLESRTVDLPLYVGMSMGFYNEIKAMALRGADSHTNEAPLTHKEKQGYLMIAKTAEDSQHRLLQVAGFFDSVKLSPKASDVVGEVDDIDDIRRAMNMMLDPSAFAQEVAATLNEGAINFEFDEKDDIEIKVI